MTLADRTSTIWAIDTSVALPLAIYDHELREQTIAAVSDRPVVLSGHALNETYAQLSNQPGTSRIQPAQFVELMRALFGEPILLSPEVSAAAPAELAKVGITGPSTYDGLVALAAREHGAVLLSRDYRARRTYQAIGVEVEFL